MRINLFLVLRLNNKDNLNGDEILCVIALRHNKLRCCVHGQLGGVLHEARSARVVCTANAWLTHLEDVSNRLFTINLLLHDTVLIYSHGSQYIEDCLVHRLETVNNERNGDPLPAGDTLFRTAAPVLRLLGVADVTNVQHDAMQRSCIQRLVLIVRRDGDEQLGRAVVLLGPKRIATRLAEVVWIACRSGVSHVPGAGGQVSRALTGRCLLIDARKLSGACPASPFTLYRAVHRPGYWVFCDEVALREGDLTGDTPLDRLSPPPARLDAVRGRRYR